MNVEVLLFARSAELAGVRRMVLELPAGATVAQCRVALTQSCPALASFLPRCQLAVNGEFARDEDIVAAETEIAILPPVSGGS